MKRNIYLLILFLLLCGAGFLCITGEAHADQPLVIVIDPGHGGENLGAEYDGYTEKDMTLIVARAMKEELEKYDGVTVYLTHETDQDMSIKDRAAFAGEKNADFLFCLHFNSSIEHNLFGAEVWVPASGEYYAKGYSFAQIQMKEFNDSGLYSRGIKTRLNDKDENYYGILRYCTSEGVPAALIEHCHLDQEKDKKFYQQGKEQLIAFGRMDATAAAKYFQLKSDILGVDYSNFPVPQTDIPADIVRPDKTEPELCRIEVTNIDEGTGEVTIQMEAEDSDSYILYYRLSLDGGDNYLPLEEWPRPDAWNRSSTTCSFTIKAPFDEKIELLASASNGFDKWT
ncbi:MAG: N-acetylmuramoyl-L-alanine amidase, partial [Lachnospiraceae bacterium]|nr:N-acetylmuramoyl-L-alanine amidase [Lachnospiraceae bacterium]